MKSHLVIQEYGFELILKNRNTFDLISIETGSILDSHTFKEKIIEIVRDNWNSFTVNCSEDKYYNLIVDLAAQHSIITTKSEYILDIFMDSEYHGYYIGFYQVGEFILEKESLELKLIKSFEISKVKNGIITSDKKMFLTTYEGSTTEGNIKYYLVKILWDTSPPKILWKKELQSLCDSILLKNDHAYLGMRDGLLEIWYLKDEKCISKKQIFSSCISTIIQGTNNIILASCSGEVCAITDEGEILWKQDISNDQIYAILENNQGLHSIDIKGKYYHLNASVGNLLISRDLHTIGSCRSNLIQWRNWLIYTNSNGISSNYIKNFNKKFIFQMSDPLIRQLFTHNKGYYTGDDDGKLCFWKIGKIRVCRGFKKVVN